MTRCTWCGEDPIYVAYHDEEWGVPEHDDQALYEKLCLDGFQAGLSWIIVLKKRENFRNAFDNFDPEKIARYGKRQVNRLLKDAGIIRSQAKINGAIANAKAWLEIMENGTGSFDSFLWKHVNFKTIVNKWKTDSKIPASTPISEAITKDLKKHNFKFVGPTICYAFMQAVGMVNDHVVGCPRYAQLT
ncbi:MAG TPA: DNA-3-methyladenine glycosylase I [Phycisphaerales bacterium]|jgi:DNA-3-methyladenine glycosylase I|nr:DNA-3-methyladenine glycosylase I [Phycisphaerales bacterium]HIB50741.1 DNA-3-methyladenine glycosylase I [Phycisphaerales bacterium]HIN84289.1 DNA-3-methyladenine glycosylase I [Phycisphaerales bacterium]HIO20123.1 DNA-3-methyladenine glycosylase I [Phycisphaerales bacterium]HIO53479.1 DNA-3-methyladenine glycosylase I [Phycisphaerales bacterium]